MRKIFQKVLPIFWYSSDDADDIRTDTTVTESNIHYSAGSLASITFSGIIFSDTISFTPTKFATSLR
ncbi:MAG: hypothetical protein LBE12_04150 [Planctomycetaceae bacterium]|jgi:hypothetical protein|nr:hypothetical protein [Planctomycetaceae bacterium]